MKSCEITFASSLTLRLPRRCRQAITKESIDGAPTDATCSPDVEMGMSKQANTTDAVPTSCPAGCAMVKRSESESAARYQNHAEQPARPPETQEV